MDITLAAHGVAIPDRFKDYVDEKSDKVLALAERAQNFQVKVREKTRVVAVPPRTLSS
jgi:hypothetical protein